MNKLFKNIYVTLVFAFLYIPISIIILYSFNNASYSLLWHGFTTHWYKVLFNDSSIFVVTLHSLTIGVFAASIASILGTIAASSLFRYRFLGKNILHGLLFVLIISPDIVMAISLLILYRYLDFSLGFWSLLLSHITFCLPFVAVIVYSRISDLNKYLFEAAKDLGASEWVIFKKIIIPTMWPAILSGWLLSFTLSLDDVIISYFVSGPNYQILPLKIYSLVRVGIKPEINALCTLLLTFTLFIVIFSQVILKRK